MSKQHSDDLFRQIACRYVDNWGERLQGEQAALGQEEVRSLTHGLDRRVLGTIRARKRRRAFGTAGALAACLLLAVLLPRMAGIGITRSAAPSLEMASDAAGLAQGEADEGAAFDLAGKTVPQEEAAGEAAPAPSAPTPRDTPESLGENADGPVIPLPFSLPEEVIVLWAKQDGEKSVYHLGGALPEEVTLTLESTNRAPDTRDLTSLSIDGEMVFGSTRPDHPFLTFQRDGILYELSCRQELDTLIALSRLMR